MDNQNKFKSILSEVIGQVLREHSLDKIQQLREELESANEHVLRCNLEAELANNRRIEIAEKLKMLEEYDFNHFTTSDLFLELPTENKEGLPIHNHFKSWVEQGESVMSPTH